MDYNEMDLELFPEVIGNTKDQEEILSNGALEFLASIHNKFNKTRLELLNNRIIRQKDINAGEFPKFLPETEHIRNSEWKVASIPVDLEDRRVEITGPVDRKMIINALNSGVKVFMADFEDSNSPTWSNIINGQINLRDANNKSISFTKLDGKHYQLNDKTAALMVRPRGWHLEEKNILINNQPISASIFDFSIYFYNNVQKLISSGTGPYFYLPKLESYLEARLWNDIFNFAQDAMDIPRGTIRATVLIETITAAFEMEEILYELKDHSAGLNCGRWDYIFSFIKRFRNNPDFVLPDRSDITMDRHFLNSYVNLLINTCHKRGAHAMGGMAAQIPIKGDSEANKIALDKVKKDKENEASLGHDGTWVAHPGLVPIAMDAFDRHIKGKNQINLINENINISEADLLQVPKGVITEDGVRNNIRIGIQYLEAWLRGNGCVPLYNLMEDAATAEISRAQLWQWIHHKSKLNDGRLISVDLFDKWLNEEIKAIELDFESIDKKYLIKASKLFSEMIKKDQFDDFLTIPAYEKI
tara:strand:+ start:3104 stop:4693 length:1590 start_codon:yes stop_codon:yes gene_type:complete